MSRGRLFTAGESRISQYFNLKCDACILKKSSKQHCSDSFFMVLADVGPVWNGLLYCQCDVIRCVWDEWES